ncbi:MAG: hypothetical protein EB127_11910, partial [Alphaproteobacteria bacterium]|nr:hypothetical protein [Alphaproteobacteria bacterium]
MKNINISYEKIKNFDNSLSCKLAEYEGNIQSSLLYGSPGLEPYKLYSYLSHQVNNSIILDIGTKFANSAIALAHNENNHVISYDIIEWACHKNMKEKSNISFKIENFMDDDD